MQTRARLLMVLALGLGACGGEGALRDVMTETQPAQPLEALARDATDASTDIATSAVEALRSRGEEGHAALFAMYATEIEALRAGDAGDPRSERIRHAIDIVSGQRDGHASGLYWHTDLQEAARVSAATHRPILSLRLLGRLDEEMSCANSRYFRTVLYANAAVSDYLREHYVLHWSSERPVPRVTIDMGDGRRLTRTLTGNSIHYVIDARREVIDALPGLYAPTEFLQFVRSAEHAYANPEQRAMGPQLAHDRLQRIRRQAMDAHLTLPPLGVTDPSAIEAMSLTVGKALVETSVLNALRAPAAPPVALDPGWRTAATTVFGRDPESVFDARSRALLALKTGQSGAELEATLSALALSTVADSAMNDATSRWSINLMLVAAGDTPLALEALNTRVYAEVFLTPASDPWLGLRDTDVWDAIERLH